VWTFVSLTWLLLLLQVLVAERGPLVFVFNWHPHEDYEGLKVAAPEPGEGR
jgi:1,4-alpha-glucan branching enzyme